jgi:hypothetical protein
VIRIVVGRRIIRVEVRRKEGRSGGIREERDGVDMFVWSVEGDGRG